MGADSGSISHEWLQRLRKITVDTAVQMSCYGNEKRRPCYRLVSLACVASCIALFVLASHQAGDSSAQHPTGRDLVSRRNLLLLTDVPSKYDTPHLKKTNRVVKPFGFSITDEPAPGRSFKSCRDTFVLIVVFSAPGHLSRRNAIRETWGSEKSLAQYRAAVIFALGRVEAIQKDVQREIAAHGDILRADFADTYANLTLKSTLMLKYAAEACQGRAAGPAFIMKTDDDIFVNVPLLVSTLRKDFPGTRHRVITGCIKQRSAPKAIHPKGLTPPAAWPEFTAGAGYVFSGPLSPELYRAAQRISRPARMEDVFVTGQCAQLVAGVYPPKHDTRFSCGQNVRDDCHLVAQFTGHHISPQRQVAIWDKFSSDPNPCMDF